MKNKDTGRYSKYWICSECAKDKGWTAPDWAVTCLKGLCGWCTCPIESMLTPTVDYSGPNKTAIWD